MNRINYELIRKHKMSEDEKEEQRRSFVYGNLKLHNPDVTRRDIDKASERIKVRREY